MSTTVLFEQINAIKQLFNETSKYLENEKVKSVEIDKLIKSTGQDIQKYLVLIDELTR